MAEIPAGTATLGLRRGENGPFGWDNEFEEHSVTVPGFRIDKYKVTNGAFLRFVESGGYPDRSLLKEQDWDLLQPGSVSHPPFSSVRYQCTLLLQQMQE